MSDQEEEVPQPGPQDNEEDPLDVDVSPAKEGEEDGAEGEEKPERAEGEEGEEDAEKKEGEEGEEGDEKKEGEEEEGGEPKPDPNAEKKRVHEIFKTGLSQVNKTYDNSGYAYTNLTLQEKELKDLHDILNNYPHLKHINISQNEVQNIDSIAAVPYLLTLNASTNLINSIELFTDSNVLSFMQFVNLSNNKIVKFPAIQLPRLRKLNLNENKIDSCEDFQGHPTLEVLELRKNKLKTCLGLRDMPALRELYLAENKIKGLTGLENLPSLKNLHLRQNLIKVLVKPLPDLPAIFHFNVRENRIADVKQIKKFKYFTSLKSATIIGNPVTEELGDVKKELIILLPQLTRINKDEVTPEDREDAAQEVRDRIAQEEERQRELEEKLREEEEERKRQEDEAKGDTGEAAGGAEGAEATEN